MNATHVVIVGDVEMARLTCQLLRADGLRVTHLLNPDEPQLRQELTDDVDAVAVLVRRDVVALRYVLLTEHLLPRVAITASIFSRTIASQLTRAVPNCTVVSPADVAAPAVAARALSPELVAVRPASAHRPAIKYRQTGTGEPAREPWPTPPWWTRVVRVPRIGLGDSSARLMLSGVGGLAMIGLVDWLAGVLLLHEGPVVTFFTAARVLATVGPMEVGPHTPQWYMVMASILMLLAVGFTAIFTAGLVDWLASSRTIGLIGRRTLPRRDHVVVVGLGQVGLRVAMLLLELGIPVVAIERQADGVNLRAARGAKVPVVIGPAEDGAIQRRVGLRRARALVALGSDENDNIEVAISALASPSQARVVIRAGEGDVVAETRSLFAIMEVIDVAMFSAVATAASLRGQVHGVIHPKGTQVCAHLTDGTKLVTSRPPRCTC